MQPRVSGEDPRTVPESSTRCVMKAGQAGGCSCYRCHAASAVNTGVAARGGELMMAMICARFITACTGLTDIR